MRWPQIVLGWPAIGLALACFAFAFARERSRLGFAGLAVAVPFLWYLSRAPSGLIYAPVLIVTLGSAAVLLSKGRRRLAAACLSPFVLVVVALAAAVMTEGR
jgi:hypothetical protein